LSGEVGMNRPLKEVEYRLSLLCAGGDGGPDAFGPSAAHLAARVLRDAPVDHDKSDSLLGQVVGRFNPRRGNELEVCGPMLAETLRQILRGAGVGRWMTWNSRRSRSSTSVPYLRVALSESVVRYFTSRIRWAKQNCTRMPKSPMYLR